MNTVTRSDVIQCPVCKKKNRVPAAASGIPHCGNCHSPLPWIADAGDGNYRDVVEEASIPVLVDLWAPWCGPCHLVSPALEQLAKDFAGKVKLVKINVDESPAISQRFGVQGIPTLLVTRKGEVIARQTGAAPESTLRAWLEDVLPRAAA
ncbi:MAG: thioredoxin 2 [Acidimicrobiaceae bacterium]|jgi:thioredoxin 2